MELFKDGGTLGGCYHSHLLWSLEKLGWNVDFLPRVTRILAILSEIDPGGNYIKPLFMCCLSIIYPA